MRLLTEDFKHQVHNHKPFLSALYTSTLHGARKRNLLLQNASDGDLQILIQILHYICNREIPITNRWQSTLSKRKKTTIFRQFFADQCVDELLALNRDKQIIALRKVGPFKMLLEALFTEPK